MSEAVYVLQRRPYPLHLLHVIWWPRHGILFEVSDRKWLPLLQRTLKNYALWKKKNQSTLIHVSAKFLAWLAIFFLFKIFKDKFINFENESISSYVLLTILSNCTFICQGFEVIKGVWIVQIKTLSGRLCQRFSHTRFLPLPASFGHKFAKIKVHVVFIILW